MIVYVENPKDSIKNYKVSGFKVNKKKKKLCFYILAASNCDRKFYKMPFVK